MQNKFKFNFLFVFGAMFACAYLNPLHAATVVDEIDLVEEIDTDSDDQMSAADKASADAVSEYQVEGSLFEQITTLEQEKVLMQLEKERAQLDLELDRLAAEKIKLHMEIDTLSGRAEQAQQELETEKARLEAEAASIARQKEELSRPVETSKSATSSARSAKTEQNDDPISDKYRLVNVVGAGNQLQATVEDLATGQNKRVSVGKVLAGYTVKSISLDEGVVFVKDGVTENLNISSSAR